jgi:hypothetical protein
MTALSDFSTNAGKVRLLITDIDLYNPIFEDTAIAAFLSMNGDNVKRAAAQALLVIAVNEVLVQKRIRLLDLSTDGVSEANALRELAAQYRKEADQEATGNIGYLAVPEGIGQFDKRSPEQWARLQEAREWV